MDTVTVTDSFLVVRLTEPGQSAKQVLRTKTVENSLNPDYFETAVINYEFEGNCGITQSDKSLHSKSIMMVDRQCLSGRLRLQSVKFSEVGRRE